MLVVASALTGYAIEASDGPIGSVSDFLFDETTWRVRWLVVDTGGWLPGRQVLIHPSAIGSPDHESDRLPVALTRQQVKDSPDIFTDQPVSRQMESHLYDYYGWDPLWGVSLGGAGILPLPVSPPIPHGDSVLAEALRAPAEVDPGDPHLFSLTSINGYHLHAKDGVIGHIENVLIDDIAWDIRYLIADTRNWWPGQRVVLSPYASLGISWDSRELSLSITRDQVKGSPPWDPEVALDDLYARSLHSHYGWPDHGTK